MTRPRLALVLQILCSVNTLKLAFMAQYRALHLRGHFLRPRRKINFEQCHVPIVRAIVTCREGICLPRCSRWSILNRQQHL
jgi:hypothetical protein